MDNNMAFRQIEAKGFSFFSLLIVIGALITGGMMAAYYMEHNGHHVTGMSNQIVWGIPHVFAVFLIISASGALNVASIASVFGKKIYKPLAPLSGLLAISLLAGGLAVLVLDLGRPDRLLVAMTTYNFKSIFAWNMILYNGFFAIVALYIWVMLEKRFNKYSSLVGTIAFVWRLLLTIGTGSIFGFLVARQAYDAAIMGPMFVLMSFSFGLAIFILVLAVSFKGSGREIGPAIIERLRKLLGIFVLAVLFFVAIFHLSNLYATEHHGIEKFILDGDNVYTGLFWLGYILIGSIIPLVACYMPMFKASLGAIVSAGIMVIAGGLSLMYVIIIGGQAYPIELFPGKDVSSRFFDGVIASYTPTLAEVALGVGGVAIAIAIVIAGISVLKFLPVSLADSEVDPHHNAETTG